MTWRLEVFLRVNRSLLLGSLAVVPCIPMASFFILHLFYSGGAARVKLPSTNSGSASRLEPASFPPPKKENKIKKNSFAFLSPSAH